MDSGLVLRTPRNDGKSCPTGKSLLVYRNRVKPQNKKYFAFPEGQIRAYLLPSRPAQRGVGQRHDVGRVAVDVEVPVTNGAKAYGKDVWS
jgi:hypothetical protein